MLTVKYYFGRNNPLKLLRNAGVLQNLTAIPIGYIIEMLRRPRGAAEKGPHGGIQTRNPRSSNHGALFIELRGASRNILPGVAGPHPTPRGSLPKTFMTIMGSTAADN
jgi:hypothetical protein